MQQWMAQQQMLAASMYAPQQMRVAANVFPTQQVDSQTRNDIIAKYIVSAEGRKRLATSMIQPLRRRRDYQSVGRKAFYVEHLPDGALPIYDKDPELTAYTVAEEGENLVATSKPKRVLFPLFELASNPEISLTEIKQRRFDLVERSVDLAKVEIQAEEDRKVFAVMDALGTDVTSPNQPIPVTGNVTANVLADAFANVERTDLRVANVFMNAKDFADLRKFDRDTLDTETQAILWKTGLVATIWGSRVIVSRIVPEGTIYVCSEPEFFGRLPVRTELTVISADLPRERKIGFSVFENIGIGAYNAYALQILHITR
jgi:HK97 family phage major capsid protein